MLEERSAGAIIYRQSPQGKMYLLLNYPSGHWDFVKGNIEKGEALRETVLREAREETGITDITFVDGFEDKVEYHYQRDGQVIHKEVAFFLATTNTDKITLSFEHQDYTWLGFDEALAKLTYKTAQNVFKKVKDL
ncbi:NUDIX hydrolase [Nitrosotalea sinensis]|uniref:Bis(5'-nucleosyl)-tetraphosphatase [asymmetrical] n=1 Tax=Nitrosotalea sinensis TaxID=1499975 RepID=A0A2H1EG46_9ARCH|nr:NUDIX domain-containing protein [Candidatus Nitrosotalea sinensis]SHO45024.1 NUDIX hydrolase [Candidatus Nitrosotalea sinensis]